LEEENKELQDKVKELTAKLGGNYKPEKSAPEQLEVADGKKKKGRGCCIV
jgi:hypothetical protein